MKIILFRHGHSLANLESRIVSSLKNGTTTNGGPTGTGFGLSSQGETEVSKSAKLLARFILQRLESGVRQGSKSRAQIQILTSPFQRTQQTARLIYNCFQHVQAEAQMTKGQKETLIDLDLDEAVPQDTIDLRERFFGEFEMQTPSDELYDQVWANDSKNPFHELFGVESVAAVTQRVTGVVRSLEETILSDQKRIRAEETGEQITPQQMHSGERWVILVSHGDALQILQTAMKGWSGDRHRQLEHLDTASWRLVEWCPELTSAHQ